MQAKTFFILIFLLVQKTFVQSQSLPANTQYFVTANYGFLWAHRENMKHLVTSHFYLIEAGYSKFHDGSKAWERLYNNPSTGFYIVYSNLGNNPALGKTTGVLSFIDLPFNSDKKIKASFRIAGGLAYVSKKFHRETNFSNVAIGSHLNSAIAAALKSETEITNNIALEAAIGLTHFSNGSFKTPNLGLNIPTISLGIKIKPNSEIKLQNVIDTINNTHAKWNFYTNSSFGFKEIYPAGGEKFLATTLSFIAEHALNDKHNLGAAADVFYDRSILKKVSTDTNFTSVKNSYAYRAGIALAYSLKINKISIPFQMGYYYLDPYKGDGNFYHRVGVRYHVNQNWIINTMLKSHFAKADYFEFGFGYHFQ